MKTLRQVGVGQTVTVKRLHGEGPVKRRIMDMGITKGVPERQVQQRLSAAITQVRPAIRMEEG